MARPGINYDDVKQAAVALSSRGINPTIQRIRDYLGSGSNTTIANHLKHWQQQLGDDSEITLPKAVPAELMPAVEAFWQAAEQLAAQAFASDREAMHKQMEISQQEQDSANKERDQIQRILNEVKQHAEKLETRAAALEHELITEREQKAVIINAAHVTQNSLETRLATLEQEKIHARQHITGLNKQLSDSQQQYQTQQQQNQQQQLELTRLQQQAATDARQLVDYENRYQQISNEYKHATAEVTRLTSESNKMQQEIGQLEIQLRDKDDQLDGRKQQLLTAQDNNKLLTAELQQQQAVVTNLNQELERLQQQLARIEQQQSEYNKSFFSRLETELAELKQTIISNRSDEC